MKYYFLSGRNFNLSTAELLSLLPNYSKEHNLEYLEDLAILVETKENIDFLPLFEQLGGFISFGKVISEDFNFVDAFKEREKVVFGINIWGERNDLGYEDIRKLGESLKDSFKENNISAKFLVSKDLSLNSIQIEKRKNN